MPCGLPDLQPADGLAAAGCRLAARHARRKLRLIGSTQLSDISHLTFVEKAEKSVRGRHDASTLVPDGGLKVETA
jgi:hypothetical protein